MARPHGLLFVALLAASGVPGPARAAGSVDSCTGFISSVPTTLSSQGTWCLTKDLSASITNGAAITIGANNVTVDCGGYKIGGLSAGPGTATIGIRAVGRQNAAVRDCAVRGFQRGISLEGGGHVVEGNRLDGNTYLGIFVSGDGGYVRDNRVYDTGGSTVPMSSGIPFAAIQVEGAVDVLDNVVSGVLATAGSTRPAAGVIATDAPTTSRGGATIAGNRIRDVVSDGSIAIGIGALSGAHQPASDFAYEAEAVTWPAAEAACQASGGHLASIGSALDNFTVQGLVIGSGSPAWTGGNDVAVEGVFAWSDGSMFAYSNWAPGQPDDDVGTGGGGDHVAMMPDGTWADFPPATDSYVAGYVCEVAKPILRMSIRDNVLTAGEPSGFGMLCQDVDGRLTGNVLGGFALPVAGCADGGFNHTIP